MYRFFLTKSLEDIAPVHCLIKLKTFIQFHIESIPQIDPIKNKIEINVFYRAGMGWDINSLNNGFLSRPKMENILKRRDRSRILPASYYCCFVTFRQLLMSSYCDDLVSPLSVLFRTLDSKLMAFISVGCISTRHVRARLASVVSFINVLLRVAFDLPFVFLLVVFFSIALSLFRNMWSACFSFRSAMISSSVSLLTLFLERLH